MRGHEDGIRRLIYLAEKHQLVSSSWDKTIKVWSLTTGLCVISLSEHTSSVNSIILLPKLYLNRPESHLVSGSNDNSIKIWSLNTGKCLHTLRGHTSLVKSVLLMKPYLEDDTNCNWNISYELVSSSNDKTIRIWNLNRAGLGQCMKILYGHERGINCLSMLLIGELLVSASSDQTIKVWNLSKRGRKNGECVEKHYECEFTLKGHEDAVKCLIFY